MLGYLQPYILCNWTLLSSLLAFNYCRELSGYNFPVFTTIACPKDKLEFQERSVDINCTDTKYYMCVPNENFTELLEFCFHPNGVRTSKGLCIYLDNCSAIKLYGCENFTDGCPTSWYYSFKPYEFFSFSGPLNVNSVCDLNFFHVPGRSPLSLSIFGVAPISYSINTATFNSGHDTKSGV
uniref:Uncharacterized protein LOC111114972 isoform X2 n=1 Tax=Crassostrea virginica TaxID=6565 RepID=A0A8B8C0Q0_CRAVI|nr:uncharacterized protein LOC111114972 isoform X2 [Crassostrea virginica]